ncbi:MAG: hypothetical protein AB7N53_16730 [Candidatus Binatia bacterium]
MLVFPALANDAGTDTVLPITTLANSRVYAYRFHVAPGPARANGGFTLVGLAERRSSASAPVLSRAASNGHNRGEHLEPDLIELPL